MRRGSTVAGGRTGTRIYLESEDQARTELGIARFAEAQSGRRAARFEVGSAPDQRLAGEFADYLHGGTPLNILACTKRSGAGQNRDRVDLVGDPFGAGPDLLGADI